MGGGWRMLAVWSRDGIAPDARIAGPALIEEAYTTVLIGDGWNCRRHASGHLLAERA
jgi:N-methylhydantoinase A